MELTDYSPPAFPSEQQQIDALQKGLGRAALWARQTRLSPDILLDACLADKRYDTQCEENRGEWLWTLMEYLGIVAAFRTPILDELINCTSDRRAYQLCELVERYAAAGDRGCRDVLWAFVEKRQVPDETSIGEGQLLSLYGLEAFAMIARVRGESLKTREWSWNDDAVVDRAIDLLGESQVRSFLGRTTDPDVVHFAKLRQVSQENPYVPVANDERNRRLARPAARMIELAHGTDDNRGALRSWGRAADDTEIRKIVAALWEVSDPEVIQRLLWAFLWRALPQFDTRLIDLCQHPDQKVRRLAFEALANNADPAVRQFALEQLEHSPTERVVCLFEKNYLPGDEQRIFEAMKLPGDPNELHSLLMDTQRVLEENQSADASELALVIYFATPCSCCRLEGIRLLAEEDAIPSWLMEEASHDASDDIRKFIAEIA